MSASHAVTTRRAPGHLHAHSPDRAREPHAHAHEERGRHRRERRLSLTSANTSSPALLFVSFASAPAAFKGGVLVAYPFTLTVALATDGSGALLLPFTWPSGVPAATSPDFQYAVQDSAGPQGASLSNALKAVTP